MTQGIFVKGQRSSTKKAIREAVENDPRTVELESTSLSHGGEYNGPVTKAPPGVYYFVGPDPYTARKYYGQIRITQSQGVCQFCDGDGGTTGKDQQWIKCPDCDGYGVVDQRKITVR